MTDLRDRERGTLTRMATMWTALGYCHGCELHMSIDLTRVDGNLIAPVPTCDNCDWTDIHVVTVVASDTPIGVAIDTYCNTADHHAWMRASGILKRHGVI